MLKDKICIVYKVHCIFQFQWTEHIIIPLADCLLTRAYFIVWLLTINKTILLQYEICKL